MTPSPAFAALAALLALAPLRAAQAQERGDPARGRAFAQEVCTPCHRVIPQQFALRLAQAPSFESIAAKPGLTALALRAFLQTPHPEMPSLILEPGEADDVIAYLLSLAPARRN